MALPRLLRCLAVAAAAAVWLGASPTLAQGSAPPRRNRNAYVGMMYMGTPRDYEFYLALRVLMRSLANLRVHADRVVIASKDVPFPWVKAMEEEDGVKVVRVEDIKNPYENYLGGTDKRFKRTLNKLYAWSLVDYDRVVMLDSDNLFIQNTDELFQCGQFCAVFINPCYFHTGLFVLQPNKVVFQDMLHQVEAGPENSDGADQGFLANYFADLLDRPMFHPPPNGSNLNGTYRLPLGYQMDASYYYLKLRWHVPCGPNSVITFPSAPWFKPWYWWSWPILPLGLSWHQRRWDNLGYGAEMPAVTALVMLYIGVMAIARFTKPSCLIKSYYIRRSEKKAALVNWILKLAVLGAIATAYTIPFWLVPRTLHPLMGWSLYLLGALALSMLTINAFMLPPLAVLTKWLGIAGLLCVLAYPWYPDGIIRIAALFGYSFAAAPFLWASMAKVARSLHAPFDGEQFFPKLGERTQETQLSKLY